MTSRGIRNNNPGNIRINANNNWMGTNEDGDDESFVSFTSPAYGIRALSKILLRYYTHHNLKSVSEIINRWAPQHENDTKSYITSVADRVGINSDSHIPLTQEGILELVVRAIIKHENGSQPYSDEIVLSGLHAATRGNVI